MDLADIVSRLLWRNVHDLINTQTLGDGQAEIRSLQRAVAQISEIRDACQIHLTSLAREIQLHGFPWIALKVCQRWRAIFQSQPTIWSHFMVEELAGEPGTSPMAPLHYTMRQLGSACPFSFTLKLSSQMPPNEILLNDSFPLLAARCSQWKHVVLNAVTAESFLALYSVLGATPDLSMLESMCFEERKVDRHGVQITHPQELFGNAPRLELLCLQGLNIDSTITLPRRIKKITTDIYDKHALLSARTLDTYEVYHRCNVALERLQRRDAMMAIAPLTEPMRQDLSFYIRSEERHHGLQEADHLRRMTDMLKRARPPLRKLFIAFAPYPSWAELQALMSNLDALCPMLEEFSVRVRSDSGPGVGYWMKTMITMLSTTLPHLITLKVWLATDHWDRNDFDWVENLVDLVESRSRSLGEIIIHVAALDHRTDRFRHENWKLHMAKLASLKVHAEPLLKIRISVKREGKLTELN
ncbi:hypothetical protein BDZ89DRAFT_1069589 [Hymenopellis radicata]|nr:hypothetical protein BDZ89DRAFT_1069589 [Hymenopellis radicata]